MAKIDDFVTTAQEKYHSSENLITTEKTDAINSGIVDGSSKLQRHGYSPSLSPSHHLSRNTNVIKDRQDANSVEGDKSHDDYEQGSGQIDPESTTSQKFSSKLALKKSLTVSATQSMRKGVHKALEDSELEGLDDAYYRGKNIKKTVRTGKTVLAKVTGKQAAKKKATDAAKTQAQKQFKSYFQKNVYKTAATRNVQKAATKKTLLSLGKPILGKVALITAPVILFIFALLMSIILLTTLFASSGAKESNSFGSLSGVQLEVAQALRAQGLRDIQIAAIMGNISGESGWNPKAEYHGNGSRYEYGYGLFQFTDTRQGVGNYTNYKNWAQAHGKALDSAAAQTEYFISQLHPSWYAGLHSSGYYAAEIPQFVGKNASYAAFLNSSDLAFSTYAFLACYERPADWAAESSYPVRYAEAQKFYAQLTSSGGAELNASTETQKRIVAIAHLEPTTDAGLCQAWVSNVYESAGYAISPQPASAREAYNRFANNRDRSQLKVGMVVATPSSSSGTSAGLQYGHVGIYIGDGKIIHSIGYVQTISLDEWISIYGKHSPVGWGYPPSVSGK
ncbi:membrane protein [Streptococcus equi subsp. zooepidemicus Sz12is]|uniref:phage tail tip lysozyme n=1 Tax=Streptococcus equi TaxID=1336 RepID=UPI0005BB151D|nr:phage tail tip lysozyme [Streptococcus equi]KIS05207.1 membrane protein [Streptococcus equi subsp. zooepidemicus Sz12is]